MLAPHWKSYFIFSKKELKGIIVLGFVLFSSVLVRFVFLTTTPDSALGIKANYKRFFFDPNTIDSLGAIALGIPVRQVKSLLHYRQKGGYFKDPDDFVKLYGLTPILFEQLKPYIRMKHTNRKYNTAYNQFRFTKSNGVAGSYDDARFSGNTLREWTIDINVANEQEWVLKANLSEQMARRILAYKNYLGFFAQVHQIKKVYGMSDSLFQFLRSHLRVGVTNKYLLNVQSMQFNEWKKLDLFTDAQIWEILKLRKENGGKLSWTQLVELGDLAEEQALELKRKLKLSD